MPRPPALDPLILTVALQGLEAQRAGITDQIAQVKALLGDKPSPAATREVVAQEETASTPPRRKLSPAGRKRIVDALKARWAAYHKAQAAAADQPQKARGAKAKKRRLSAASRKAMADAAKRRWAAVRAKAAEAKKAARKKVAKKTAPPAGKKVQVKKAAPVKTAGRQAAKSAPKRIAKKVGRKAVSKPAPPAPQNEATEAASA